IALPGRIFSDARRTRSPGWSRSLNDHALRPFFGRGWFFEPTTRVFDNESQSFAMGIAAVLLDRNHTKLFGNQAIGRF
ncbi:MAG: hypothetical protein WCF66_10005, partial [Pseudolabrys sp.]